jgi:hypothetical protein
MGSEYVNSPEKSERGHNGNPFATGILWALREGSMRIPRISLAIVALCGGLGAKVAAARYPESQHAWELVALACFAVLGVVLILWLATWVRSPALHSKPSHATEVAARMQDEPGLSQNEKWISLTDASKIMYDELEGTVWRAMADKEATQEDRLNYLAAHLARNAPIEGRSPPSRGYKPIASGDFDAGIIKGGGKYFQREYESYLTFLDMRIKETDLREALKKMKGGE